MKLSVEATPQELEEKSGDLLKALAEIIGPVDPDVAEVLAKALPRKEPALKFPVLRALQRQTEAAYDKTVEAILKEIGAVLDRGVEKSEKTHDHTKAIAAHDDIAYKRVKQVLIGKGYTAEDFNEGGPLYGWSTNQLIDLARDKRAG